jgi:hypothetical protein
VTTAPTAAQVDTYVNNNTLLNTMIAYAVQNGEPETTAGTFWVVGATQNDASVYVAGPMYIDPTSNWDEALTIFALVNQYTNVTVREYIIPNFNDVTSITATSFLADPTEQARVNNPSNWATAP